MSLTGALLAALSVIASAGAGEGRTLLCRPRVAGEVAAARGEAVATAARAVGGKLLDYGVACEDPAEAVRAARRAGLAHAISGTAEGLPGGSRFVLVLSDAATEAERARRSLEVAPGADAVRPVRGALEELLRTLPPPPGPKATHVAGWALAGAGVAGLAAGVVIARDARAAADRANRASAQGDRAAYEAARADWTSRRQRAGLAAGLGAGALAAGLTLRLVF